MSHDGVEGLVQSAFVAQPTQLPTPGSQTCGAVQSAFLLQPLHVLVVVSQTGVFPLQSALVRQAAHAPLVVSHFGVAPEHSASFEQALQVCVVVSHVGLPGVVQLAFVVHAGATHWPCVALPSVVSHVGVAPEQSAAVH